MKHSAMRSSWKIPTIDEQVLNTFYSDFPLKKHQLALMYGRGYTNHHLLDSFIHSRVSAMHSPFLINGMQQAVNRVRDAITKKETIGIFADSDLDGITSLTVLYTLFNKMNIQPSMRCLKNSETYGLKKEIIDEFKLQGVSLLITVDSGIRDIDEIAYAQEQGIEVIVTDHHEQDRELPEAIIVNPKILESGYPFKELAGVGVAFKFAQAILMSYLPGFNKNFIIVTGAAEGFELVHIKNSIIEKYTTVKTTKELYQEIDADRTIVLLFDADSVAPSLIKQSEVYNFTDFYADVVKKNGTISLEELCAHYSFNSYLYKNRIELLAKLFLEMQATSSTKIHEFIRSIVGFVAIGSIADIVPLVDENRILVKKGIESLQGSTHPGLAFLNQDVVTAKNIAWDIAPLLNTPGRYGRTQLTVDFFLADDYTLIRETIEKIKKLNDERKESVNRLVALYKAEIDSGALGPTGNMFFIKSAEIPEGIAGLIANRLAEIYNKPVVIGAINQETRILKGSGRAHGNKKFFSFFADYTDQFIDIGGHEQAFGFTIKVENVDALMREIGAVIDGNDDSGVCIDLELQLKEISVEFIKDLNIMEPFGKGNEEPLFLSRNITIESFSPFGSDGKHGKVVFGENSSLTAIWWNKADVLRHYFTTGKPVDVLYTLTNHEFRNVIYPRMMLVDVVPSE